MRHDENLQIVPYDEKPLERPIFLAVDQELGEGGALWVSQEPSDPVSSFQVGGHICGAKPELRSVQRKWASKGPTRRPMDPIGVLSVRSYRSKSGSVSIGPNSPP